MEEQYQINNIQLDRKQLTNFAADLLINQNRTAQFTKNELIKKGADNNEASQIVRSLVNQIDQAKKGQANKDIIWGAIILTIGLVLTFSLEGAIFYGAILVGLVKLGKGIYTYVS